MYHVPVRVSLYLLLLAALACGPSDPLPEIRELQRVGEFQQTVGPLRKLVEEDPSRAEAGLLLGKALLRTGNAGLAVWPLREAAESPEHAIEAGVLLARDRGEREILGPERLREIESRFGDARASHTLELSVLAREENLELACDQLVHFAHWITPVIVPKRFDTHFFLVAAPPDQVALHAGGESVDSPWTTPAAALGDADAGRCTIVFPTRLNLMKLARSHAVGEALEAARAAPIVTVMPRIEQTDAGEVLRIPAEAGYDVIEAPLATMVLAFRGGR